MKFFINFIVLIATICSTQAVDYCALRAQLCSTREHIACTPNSFPFTTCTNMVVVPMTQALKDVIVLRHNQYRQLTANGSVNSLPAAARMREMFWDDELANLAEVHVTHCTFAHDQCHGTTNYPYSGQNLAKLASTAPNTNATDRLIRTIDLWFNENALVTAAMIDSLPTDISKIGHFTVMMRENNVRVGCAYITYSFISSGYTWYGHMITCNYADTNFFGAPVYSRGAPCSNCNAGTTCSINFSNLCA